MKKFKLGTNEYECDDEYTHAAMDANGEVYVYKEKPILFKSEEYWDHPHMNKLEPLQVYPLGQPEWKETLVEI